MTRTQRDIQRKPRVFNHSKKIGDIRHVVILAFHDSSIYIWKASYEQFEEEGLIKKNPCTTNRTLRTSPEIEEKVLYVRKNYHLGQIAFSGI